MVTAFGKRAASILGALTLLALGTSTACSSSGGGTGGEETGPSSGSGSPTSSSSTSSVSSSGASSSGSGSHETCYLPANFTCTQDQLTADQCTEAGGTAGPTCPSDGLVGCCGVTAGGFTGRNCYYQGGALDATAGKANCQQQNGTWSTTP